MANQLFSPATDDSIQKAAAILRGGGLVAMPTETVYGLAADAGNEAAIAKIFAAKDRPSFNPLIVHVESLDAALRLVEFPDGALDLARRFWPGPLTLVLRQKPGNGIARLASANLDTLAVRVPNHKVALRLLRESGRPLAAPSANRSGDISPTRAEHVAKSLGDKVDMILDGGECQLGLESTIVDYSGPAPMILRLGGLAAEDLGNLPLFDGKGETVKAPGMLLRHYAPKTKLRIGADNPQPNEALLAFGPAPSGFAHVLNLSEKSDLIEAAANLYAFLHALDSGKYSSIATMNVPDHGLGRAINDRLRRAAKG